MEGQSNKTSIGGFFELELPTNAAAVSYHPDAIALSTGRACLRLMIQNLNISKCYVPFFCCDALYDPFTLEGVQLEFYGIDSELNPVIEPELKTGEYFLYVNYFGIKSKTTLRLIEKYANSLIVDDTHSFFKRGYASIWSFTSARKYFGVPDGAYLYAKVDLDSEYPRNDNVTGLHNLLRYLGHADEAFREYRRHEESLNCDILKISKISENLLASVDYSEVQRKREVNFKYLHERLGHLNQLSIDENLEYPPFVYPILPPRLTDRTKLYAKRIFIPELWNDPSKRRVNGFEFDKCFGLNLLPLSIDHRYSEEDMERLADEVLEIV